MVIQIRGIDRVKILKPEARQFNVCRETNVALTDGELIVGYNSINDFCAALQAHEVIFEKNDEMWSTFIYDDSTKRWRVLPPPDKWEIERRMEIVERKKWLLYALDL